MPPLYCPPLLPPFPTRVRYHSTTPCHRLSFTHTKALDDVASHEELWQWLKGPMLENVMKCENDEDPYSNPFKTGACRINDQQHLRCRSFRQCARAHARVCVCVCVCVLSTHLLPLPGGARLRGHVAVVAQGARGLQVAVERDVELFAVTRWGEASEWTSCRQRCEAREERGEREPCNDDSVYACENNVRRECAVRRGCETPRRNTSFYCRSALGLDECGTPAEPQNPVGWGQARAKGGRRLQPAQGHKSDESPTHPTPTTTTAAHTAL